MSVTRTTRPSSSIVRCRSSGSREPPPASQAEAEDDLARRPAVGIGQPLDEVVEGAPPSSTAPGCQGPAREAPIARPPTWMTLPQPTALMARHADSTITWTKLERDRRFRSGMRYLPVVRCREIRRASRQPNLEERPAIAARAFRRVGRETGTLLAAPTIMASWWPLKVMDMVLDDDLDHGSNLQLVEPRRDMLRARSSTGAPSMRRG